MADVTREVKKYLDKISLLQNQKEELRRSREALADQIKDHFREEGRKIPDFKQQGSFDMGTIIQPIDGEYDLDYGVYLQGYSDDEDEWPAPATVHNWIIDAVKNHTQTDPENKKTCVRVIYKGNYHIDLPIYIESESKCKLAHLGKGWIQSQPKDITLWFQEQINDKGIALRDVVKILKGWADYQDDKYGKMPSGLVLTILAADNFVDRDRLDECVYETVKGIYWQIKDQVEIYNPADPNEKISDRLSDQVKHRFQEKVKTLADDLKAACKEESFAQSSKLWNEKFGDRFPIASDPDEEQKKNITILIEKYGNAKTIKPWGYKF